ncbi:MAG: efflux RND transporter periplasmic adaptor subunit [Alphaproteobacteria bacterium]|nr:efflux RND transporter periplasmic adaptor subunit [Alphaproteobacteria bacterium]
MIRNRKWLKWGAPVVVLGIAVLIAGVLQATKPRLEPRAPAERQWMVEVVDVVIADQRPELRAFGEVVAERDAEMRALVAGQVVEVGPAFNDGGVVRQGELLVRIDPFEYEARLDEAQANLAEANALLTEYEAMLRSEQSTATQNQVQFDLAQRELDRRETLFREQIVSEKHVDDGAMAASERARAYTQAEENAAAYAARAERQLAVIKQAEVAVKRARRDLDHTRLVAPFDGYLTGTSAAIGKRLTVNDRIARLLDLDRLEVRFHLSDSEFGRLAGGKSGENGMAGRDAYVLWRVGERDLVYPAMIDRIGGEIDAASGGIRAYASVASGADGVPLRPGAFVEVVLADQLLKGAVVLPESALHQGHTVYVENGGRLEARAVKMLLRAGAEIFVRGDLATAERVVVTRFAEIGPGLMVRTE